MSDVKEGIIHFVRQKPTIYERSLPTYKDKTVRKNAFINVKVELQNSGFDVEDLSGLSFLQ